MRKIFLIVTSLAVMLGIFYVGETDAATAYVWKSYNTVKDSGYTAIGEQALDEPHRTMWGYKSYTIDPYTGAPSLTGGEEVAERCDGNCGTREYYMYTISGGKLYKNYFKYKSYTSYYATYLIQIGKSSSVTIYTKGTYAGLVTSTNVSGYPNGLSSDNTRYYEYVGTQTGAPVVNGLPSGGYVTNAGISIGGTVSDPDSDIVVLTVSANNVVKTVTINTAYTLNWGVSFTSAELSEGRHTVTISADDGKGGVGNTTTSVVVDRTKPTAPTIGVTL